MTYDDFTVDIAENRLLRAAAERLLRLPGVDESTRRALRRLLLRLSDVSPLVLGPGSSTRWEPSRLTPATTSPSGWPSSCSPRSRSTSATAAYASTGSCSTWPLCSSSSWEWLCGRRWRLTGRRSRPASPTPTSTRCWPTAPRCTLPRGHPVYAAGNEVPARHQVRRGLGAAGVEIVCHALDLDVEPTDLLGQVRRLAAELAADAPELAAATT